VAADGASTACDTGDAVECSAGGCGDTTPTPAPRRSAVLAAPASCRGVESSRSPVVLLPGLAPRCRAVADVPQHHAVPLTTRWCGHLVAALLAPAPAVARTPQVPAAPVPRYGTVRGELVPVCDFPLGLHRETAGCGMLAITFVHFPGREGPGRLCRLVRSVIRCGERKTERYVSMVSSRHGRRTPVGDNGWSMLICR
jgi:hypothetical protein